MTVITISLLSGYIWLVFDLPMLATLLTGVMFQGTIVMFVVGLWLVMLSCIFFFFLGIALLFFFSIIFDKIEEYIVAEGI